MTLTPSDLQDFGLSLSLVLFIIRLGWFTKVELKRHGFDSSPRFHRNLTADESLHKFNKMVTEGL